MTLNGTKAFFSARFLTYSPPEVKQTMVEILHVYLKMKDQEWIYGRGIYSDTKMVEL